MTLGRDVHDQSDVAAAIAKQAEPDLPFAQAAYDFPLAFVEQWQVVPREALRPAMIRRPGDDAFDDVRDLDHGAAPGEGGTGTG